MIMNENVEFVTRKQWDGYARRIEKKNMKEHGHSITFSGIARNANSYIVEIELDSGGMWVKKGWRKAMREQGAV